MSIYILSQSLEACCHLCFQVTQYRSAMAQLVFDRLAHESTDVTEASVSHYLLNLPEMFFIYAKGQMSHNYMPILSLSSIGLCVTFVVHTAEFVARDNSLKLHRQTK